MGWYLLHSYLSYGVILWGGTYSTLTCHMELFCGVVLTPFLLVIWSYFVGWYLLHSYLSYGVIFGVVLTPLLLVIWSYFVGWYLLHSYLSYGVILWGGTYSTLTCHMELFCGVVLTPLLLVIWSYFVGWYLLHSYLSYGVILWGGTYSTNLNSTRVSQKKAVRYIYSSTYNAHTHPLFQDSKIL